MSAGATAHFFSIPIIPSNHNGSYPAGPGTTDIPYNFHMQLENLIVNFIGCIGWTSEWLVSESLKTLISEQSEKPIGGRYGAEHVERKSTAKRMLENLENA